ncbi:hypothetical protein C0J52_12834 [Blattella germanica]|nr:hypothetical protein C0J52_12834 [Blattella germanica]
MCFISSIYIYIYIYIYLGFGHFNVNISDSKVVHAVFISNLLTVRPVLSPHIDYCNIWPDLYL